MLPYRTLVAIIATITALAGLAWYAHSSGITSGRAEVQAKWDSQKVILLQANADAVATAAEKTKAQKALVAKLKTEFKNEKTRISAGYQRTIDSLSDRPTENSDSGSVPQAGTAGAEPNGWATGARLYKEHGTFLAGEAALATELQKALKACLEAK